MLSEQVVSSQRFVLINDKFTQEKWASNILRTLLRERNEAQTSVKELPTNKRLRHEKTFELFLNECETNFEDSNTTSAGDDSLSSQNSEIKWNVILPALSDLLCYQSAAYIFSFLHELRMCSGVKRIFLWVQPKLIMHEHAGYVVAALEHMADLVLDMQTRQQLSILARSTGGSVSKQQFLYSRDKQQFSITKLSHETKVEASSKAKPSAAAPAPASEDEPTSTFRIQLSEDELVARNALPLPYEKKEANATGEILYSPDANDDIDAEDPDEDLNI